MFTKINNKKLVSCKVFKNPIKFVKTVHLNGFYYEFPKINETYPLELAVQQIDGLDSYDLVFFKDIENSNFIGVFRKNPIRKTVLIEKQYFSKQLTKYSKLLEKIAIINSSEILEEDSEREFFKNVNFIMLEKLPDLIDPNKEKLLIRKYILTLCIMIIAYLAVGVQHDSQNESLKLILQKVELESNQFRDLSQKKLQQQLLLLPSKKIQSVQLEQLLNKSNNGELK